ncbi:MAG: IS110 family transposase [Lactobacillales bacterium]|jgi:transposase|nr:IS110 family transposase [Lactobacillales bacterium]
MITVGIDVAKSKHDCCILDSKGEILEQGIRIANSRKGFNELIESIDHFIEDDHLVRVGLEATGHYSEGITFFMKAQNYDVIVFNPLAIKLAVKAQTLRKTKTDKADALVIAKVARSSSNKPLGNFENTMFELREATRFRLRSKQHLAYLKVQLKRLNYRTFPELEGIVKNIHCKYIYALIKAFSNKEELSKAHLTKLSNVLSKASRGSHSQETALRIRDAAKSSIGIVSKSLTIETISIINQIENIQEEINKIELYIKGIVDELDCPIMSIPGISYNLASVIISELKDIDNFQNPNQILAFAGLEPSINESGQFVGKGKMVKRGSKNLRWALFEAAKSVSSHCLTFGSYLNKKIKENKHYFVAISHVAKKLVRVIFHLLKTKSKFNIEFSI